MESKKILLTGASGKLGQAIIRSELFSNLLIPSHQEVDITHPDTLENFFLHHPIEGVIHCAALSKVADCQINPLKAMHVNSIGTSHLVSAIIKKEIRDSKTIRMIHISTDGVYRGTQGLYSEHSETIPSSTYGWTKLGAETSVRLLSNFCIIRTSFFDPTSIPFDTAPIDQFSSKLPIQDLVQATSFLLNHSFVGVINVGNPRQSQYERYKQFKPSIQPCTFKDIQKKSSGILMQDASMDCTLWNSLRLRT